MEKIEGQRSFRIVGGYDRLLDAMQKEVPARLVAIHLGTVVTDVRWKRGAVEVRAGRRKFHARRLVVTLPLGVLQAAPPEKGAVRFDPALPDKEEIAAKLGAACVVKLTIRFTERFWEEKTKPRPKDEKNLAGLQFIMSRDKEMPTWWSSLPMVAPVLVGWAGGPAAEQLTGQGKAYIVDRGLDALARVLRVSRSRVEHLVESTHLHDWQSDPFSRCAYTYVPVGALNAQKRLDRPVEDTLFFAGEATMEADGGTVHGALQSGRQAAAEILRRRK